MKLEEQIQRQRAFFQTNQTKALGFRKKQLQQLRRSILHHEEALYAALKADLNKSKQEAFLTEIGIVLGEISNAIRNLEKWARPVKKRTPRSTFPGKSQVFKEPYGVVLILSPWNYPFQLAFAPLVGALAAGNCAVVKTSGSSVHTGKVMEAILKEAFTPEQVLCLGQEARHQEILAQKYDYIFFTGSGRVGRTVMEAASKHLTPLSLELGGKSPCFVHSTADLDLAAKRIAWGKFLNGGQTCVAPDYLLVDKEIKAELIEKLKVQILAMYGEAINNEDYPKIINGHHFNRLAELIAGEPNKWGGQQDEGKLKIAPTIFPCTQKGDEIMKEEIFGPILPIMEYATEEEAIQWVSQGPKPLACYVFAQNKGFIQQVLQSLSFGGGCINDVIMHLANHHLPFGGVGESGMGSYHGQHSFDTFSHQKSILKSATWLDIPLRYPPYTEKKLNIAKGILK